jgi:C1A family cysteine protease
VALEALEVDGQCNETAWPYGNVDASDHATYYRARVHARSRDDLVEAVRTTLATGRSLLVTLRLTDAWHTVDKNGNIAGPSADDQFLGGHAVVAVGHDPRGERILIRNSWGTSWGDAGHAWLTESYLRHYGFEVATLEPLPP